MTITAASVKTELAAMLQTAEANLESHWTQRITTALARASNLIQSILIGERGYTEAQLEAWDMLDDTTLSQTLFYIFEKEKARFFEWEQIVSWDQTKFLREVSILDATSSPEEVTTETTVGGGALDDGVQAQDIDSDDFNWGD